MPMIPGMPPPPVWEGGACICPVIWPDVIWPLVMPGIIKLPVLPVCGTKGAGIVGAGWGVVGGCCWYVGSDCGGGW